MAKLKLTPDLIAKTRQILANGGYAETVFTTLKIGKTTYYRWLERGEKARKGVYRDFWDGVMEATGIAELNALKIIMQSVDPRDAQWFLEHRFPDRWGRKSERRPDVTGPHGAPVEAEGAFAVSLTIGGKTEMLTDTVAE